MVQSKFIETNVEGCFLFSSIRHHDDRGFFQEIYNKDYDFLNFNLAQSNWSFSKKGVIRGIHCSPYSKLVTCVKGSIWDVVVDLRKSSPTYKKYFSQEINEKNGYQIFVPANCGHGFLSLENESAVVYFQSSLYNLDKEKSYNYSGFGISWPHIDHSYILSKKDLESKNYEF